MVSTSSTKQVTFCPDLSFFLYLLSHLLIYVFIVKEIMVTSLLSIPCRSLTNYIVLSGSIPFMVADGGQVALRRWEGESKVKQGWCSDEQSKQLYPAEPFFSPLFSNYFWGWLQGRSSHVCLDFDIFLELSKSCNQVCNIWNYLFLVSSTGYGNQCNKLNICLLVVQSSQKRQV